MLDVRSDIRFFYLMVRYFRFFFKFYSLRVFFKIFKLTIVGKFALVWFCNAGKQLKFI